MNEQELSALKTLGEHRAHRDLITIAMALAVRGDDEARAVLHSILGVLIEQFKTEVFELNPDKSKEHLNEIINAHGAHIERVQALVEAALKGLNGEESEVLN